LRREGLAPPEFGDASGGQFIQWLTGRAGMVLDGPWAIPTYQETVAFEMDIVPVPAGPACRCPSLLGGTFVIDAATDWPEQSFEFLSFITSEEQLETNVAASGAGIPGRASAFDEMDPMMQKAADYIMEVNQAFYPIQGSFAIFSKQQSEFELVFTGERSVEAALGAAADYAREVIEENYE
jgi:ABC-type glycerol-3-phosphate transport system substrate-binding protein